MTLGNNNGTDGQTDGQTECNAICGPLLKEEGRITYSRLHRERTIKTQADNTDN